MGSSGFALSNLQDATLAVLATSELPAWLWSADAKRILWANPVGAAIFGASTSAAIRSHAVETSHPAATEAARLVGTLEKNAPPSIQDLAGFAGERERALKCACSRVALRDGTEALLVVAAERAGPELTLNERLHRLLAGSDECGAIYSAGGQLLCAAQSAHAHLDGATTLSALGAQSLADAALSQGHASGRIGDHQVSLSRLGGEGASVLVLNFVDPGKQKSTLASPAPEPMAQNSVNAAKPMAATERSAVTAVAAHDRPPSERRHPLRFVWQIDELGRFSIDTGEFIEIAGSPTAGALGKAWPDFARELALDGEGQIARAVATQDTWSGLTVCWPVDDGKARLTVELSGLPVFDRERNFRGYRGFGVCRDLDKLEALAMTRPQSTTRVGEATEQELVAGQKADAAHTVEQNVVPFPANAPETGAPALTDVEHLAFRELSRKLTQGLGAAGRQSQALAGIPAAAERAVLTRETPVAGIAPDIRAILDRIPIGILIYRLNQLLYANPMFLQWSGYGSLDALIEAGGLDSLFIEPVSASGVTDDRCITLKTDRADKLALKGELIDVEWQGEHAHALVVAPERSSLGVNPGELEALKSQWKRTEQELIEAKRRAELASHAKSDFLARISHEIRTPLNSIIGFSEVMIEETFGAIGNERYRQYLKDINSSGRHLLSLINDLLDLSKIEAGKLQLTFTSITLNEIAQQCVATMQPQAARERIIMRTAFTAGLPQVLADARSIRQIVLNLLSNSLKCTPRGGQIIVSTAQTAEHAVVLRVRDTGMGMTQADIVAALEPFRQLATSPRGGTGLGLPLTKAMTEANGASFHLASAPNDGTLVEITFPPASIPRAS
jgi:signal transduction histidine kinase